MPKREIIVKSAKSRKGTVSRAIIRKAVKTAFSDPNIPDFNKSAFALKKAEKARAFIAKHGLPKDAKPSRKGK
jgi:hypothetical protein